MESEREYFYVDGQKFGCATDDRTGTPYIYSIHPYDETEYHWARERQDGSWNVYRNGKHISVVGICTAIEIAKHLMEMDNKVGLHRTGGIW